MRPRALAQAAATLIEDRALDDERPGRRRRALGHHRSAPAPRLRRRVRRLAGRVRADAAAAAGQAAADRYRHCPSPMSRSRAASAACGASTRSSSSATACSPSALRAHDGATRRRGVDALALRARLSGRHSTGTRCIAFLARARDCRCRSRRGRVAIAARCASLSGQSSIAAGSKFASPPKKAALRVASRRRSPRRCRRCSSRVKALMDLACHPARGRRGAWRAGSDASRLARARRVRRFRSRGARDPRPAGDGGRGEHARRSLRRGVRRSDRDAVRVADRWSFRAPTRIAGLPPAASRARACPARARARVLALARAVADGALVLDAERRHRGDAGRAARAAGRRRMDRAIHRDARARLAGRVSAHRPRRDEGAGRDATRAACSPRAKPGGRGARTPSCICGNH